MATKEKRDRERNRQEWQQKKKEKLRTQKEEQRKLRDEAINNGHDPDLVGINPGPQKNDDRF